MTAFKPVLYSFWCSSASWRVRIGLNLKNISYDYSAVNLFKYDNRDSDYKNINPQMKVPSLKIDNNNVIAQSLSILEYIDEEYKNSGIALLPGDNYNKSLIRNVCQLISCEIQPVNGFDVLLKLGNDISKEYMINWGKTFHQKGADFIEEMLNKYHNKNDKFMFGNEPTMAETCLIPNYHNTFIRWGVNKDNYPLYNKIYNNCSEMQQFINAHPNNQPDKEEKEPSVANLLNK